MRVGRSTQLPLTPFCPSHLEFNFLAALASAKARRQAVQAAFSCQKALYHGAASLTNDKTPGTTEQTAQLPRQSELRAESQPPAQDHLYLQKFQEHRLVAAGVNS